MLGFYGQFKLLRLRFGRFVGFWLGFVAVDDFVAGVGFVVFLQLGLPLLLAFGLFVNEIGKGGNQNQDENEVHDFSGVMMSGKGRILQVFTKIL